MRYLNRENLEKYKITKENMCFIIDFDKTLTIENCDDSWDAIANKGTLGSKLSEELTNLYKKYGPIEVDYNMDFEEKQKYMIEWYQKCMDLYYNFNLTKMELEESIKESTIQLRNSVKDFFIFAQKNDIPIIILSAGIGNTIEEVLKQENCNLNNIYLISNFIKFDKSNKMIKYNEKLIHSLNKNIDEVKKYDDKINEIIQEKEYRIVIGDLIDDIKMAGNCAEDKLVKIGFLNQKIDKNLEMYKEKFDIVLTEKDQDFNVIRKVFEL